MTSEAACIVNHRSIASREQPDACQCRTAQDGRLSCCFGCSIENPAEQVKTYPGCTSKILSASASLLAPEALELDK